MDSTQIHALLSMSYIYLYTSLYPRQRLFLTSTQEAVVQKAALDILTLIRPRWGEVHDASAVALYAFFMCGTVLTDETLQTEVITYLEAKNRDASGWAYSRVVDALRALWKKQKEVEDPRTIDWWIVLKDMRLLGFCPCGI